MGLQPLIRKFFQTDYQKFCSHTCGYPLTRYAENISSQEMGNFELFGVLKHYFLYESEEIGHTNHISK